MSLFNIKLKWMIMAYAAFILLALYGCGDTNQSFTTTGSGSPITVDGSSGTGVNDETTHEAATLPAAEEGNINGCSDKSHLEGRC